MSYMKILVDSGSDLSLEYCKKYDITVIPFSLQIEGRSVLDSERFDSAKYCEYLKVAPQAPKSIQPSPQAFLDYYRRFSDREHIIVITMSSKISGAHQSAVLARELFERENKSCRVHIVDSAGTSFAISMLAFHAAQLNQNGLPVSEIVEQLVEDTLHIGTYYLADDISFFIKADHLSSFKGSLLAKTGVKSIISSFQRTGVPKRDCETGGPFPKQCLFRLRRLYFSFQLHFQSQAAGRSYPSHRPWHFGPDQPDARNDVYSRRARCHWPVFLPAAINLDHFAQKSLAQALFLFTAAFLQFGHHSFVPPVCLLLRLHKSSIFANGYRRIDRQANAMLS